jgi:hypothetical protein
MPRDGASHRPRDGASIMLRDCASIGRAMVPASAARRASMLALGQPARLRLQPNVIPRAAVRSVTAPDCRRVPFESRIWQFVPAGPSGLHRCRKLCIEPVIPGPMSSFPGYSPKIPRGVPNQQRDVEFSACCTRPAVHLLHGAGQPARCGQSKRVSCRRACAGSNCRTHATLETT